MKTVGNVYFCRFLHLLKNASLYNPYAFTSKVFVYLPYLSLSLCICLSVYPFLSLSLSLCHSVCLFVYLSVCRSLSLSVIQSVYLSISPSVGLSLSPSLSLSHSLTHTPIPYFTLTPFNSHYFSVSLKATKCMLLQFYVVRVHVHLNLVCPGPRMQHHLCLLKSSVVMPGNSF